MRKSIEEDLSEGRISKADGIPTCIHALGAVPKAGGGGYRTITDCSRPSGESVNSHSEGLAPKFSFKSLDYAASMVKEGSMMSVIDNKSAYRAVMINPEHWTYQGFRWEDELYVDHRMCFGNRTGPYYFNLISNFIQSTLAEKYSVSIMNYLDDFLIVHDTQEGCVADQNTVIKFIRSLGFHVAWQKVTEPSTRVKYLGIVIDTVGMQLSMPEGKMVCLRDLLIKHEKANFITKKNLESLTGLLAHCSSCVRGGRTFCRRLYDLYKFMTAKGRKSARLSTEVKEDIHWWLKFSHIFNGKSLINTEEHSEAVYTDASKRGFAASMGRDWLAGSWTGESVVEQDTECQHRAPPPQIDKYDEDNINELELWAVMAALTRWYHILKNKTLVLYTDNMQVYHMILSGRSINKTCMRWIRELFWTCVLNNIYIVPMYVPTADNIVADNLSRLEYTSTRSKLDKLLQSVDLCCKNMILACCRSNSACIKDRKRETLKGIGGPVHVEE